MADKAGVKVNEVGRKHGGTRGARAKKGQPSTARLRSSVSLLCTLQDASDWSGFPYSTLHGLVTAGHLPIVRLPPIKKDGNDSRRIWIRRSDLEALIERSVERVS